VGKINILHSTLTIYSQGAAWGALTSENRGDLAGGFYREAHIANPKSFVRITVADIVNIESTNRGG